MIALDRIEGVGGRQHLERAADADLAGDAEAVHLVGELGDVEVGCGEPDALAQGRDHVAKHRAVVRAAAGQPLLDAAAAGRGVERAGAGIEAHDAARAREAALARDQAAIVGRAHVDRGPAQDVDAAFAKARLARHIAVRRHHPLDPVRLAIGKQVADAVELGEEQNPIVLLVVAEIADRHLGRAERRGRQRDGGRLQRAAAQPDLAVAIGVLPVDERDRDLGAVEQTGAHLVLDDAALGEHPDQVEVVDREPGIAPDRGAREAGIRTVVSPSKTMSRSWSVKKNCAPSFLVIRQIAASRVVSSSRCARIAGVRFLGMA